MVDDCPGNFRVFNVRRIRRSLVEIHRDLCLVRHCEHDHDGCVICSINPRGCVIVKRDIQRLMDENVIKVQQSRYMRMLFMQLIQLVLQRVSLVNPTSWRLMIMMRYCIWLREVTSMLLSSCFKCRKKYMCCHYWWILRNTGKHYRDCWNKLT